MIVKYNPFVFSCSMLLLQCGYDFPYHNIVSFRSFSVRFTDITHSLFIRFVRNTILTSVKWNRRRKFSIVLLLLKSRKRCMSTYITYRWRMNSELVPMKYFVWCTRESQNFAWDEKGSICLDMPFNGFPFYFHFYRQSPDIVCHALEAVFL